MNRPAILVENLSVRFRQFVDKKPTLRKALARRQLRETAYVEALNDVSFRVEQGEAFGIVGRNGAGKSTLLRCLAGTLRPNSGKVVVNGKTSTLLQLGVGFNPELSGRRNSYLGGRAAGLRTPESVAGFAENSTSPAVGRSRRWSGTMPMSPKRRTRRASSVSAT